MNKRVTIEYPFRESWFFPISNWIGNTSSFCCDIEVFSKYTPITRSHLFQSLLWPMFVWFLNLFQFFKFLCENLIDSFSFFCTKLTVNFSKIDSFSSFCDSFWLFLHTLLSCFWGFCWLLCIFQFVLWDRSQQKNLVQIVVELQFYVDTKDLYLWINKQHQSPILTKSRWNTTWRRI